MTRRWNPANFFWPALACGLVLAGGCQQPNARTEVMPTGEGGVAVRQVPDNGPSFAPPALSQSQMQQNAAAQDRIDALQEQLRQRDAEIARLKGQSPTPTP